MIDIQSSSSFHPFDIDWVGVRKLRYPVISYSSDGKEQSVVGEFSLLTKLASWHRGTHMSRFIEILGSKPFPLTLENIEEILIEIQQRLESPLSHIEIAFPWFIPKKAPVSLKEGLMEYRCSFWGTLKKLELHQEKDFIHKVQVPVATVCPCSKAISDRGAHNQRSLVTVRVKTEGPLLFERLISLVEDTASYPLYPVLKRVDEKHITETGYDNPKFVEDIVREIAHELSSMTSVLEYSVEAENDESIHAHSAYAYLVSKNGKGSR